jgi:hypothetical protein
MPQHAGLRRADRKICLAVHPISFSGKFNLAAADGGKLNNPEKPIPSAERACPHLLSGSAGLRPVRSANFPPPPGGGKSCFFRHHIHQGESQGLRIFSIQGHAFVDERYFSVHSQSRYEYFSYPNSPGKWI